MQDCPATLPVSRPADQPPPAFTRQNSGVRPARFRRCVRAAMIAAAFGWLCFGAVRLYYTDWQYRAVAARAKKLYHASGWPAARSAVWQALPGGDPEIRYIAGLNGLLEENGPDSERRNLELLEAAARQSVRPAEAALSTYRCFQYHPDLTGADRRLLLLTTVEHYGDRYAAGQLAAYHARRQAELLARATSRLPECLNGFQAERAEKLPAAPQTSVQRIGYRLRCPCGGDGFHFPGHTEPPENVPSDSWPPVQLRCRGCGRQIPLSGRSGDHGTPAHPTANGNHYQAIIVCLEYQNEVLNSDDNRQSLPDKFCRITIFGLRNGCLPERLFDWHCV